MIETPRPHFLTRRQRLELAGWRAGMGTWGLLSRVTRRIPTRLQVRRYGAGRNETLEVIDAALDAPPREPVVYLHGGGWIIGNKEAYTSTLGFLCARGHRVFNLDYLLAPEHPYPLPLRSLVRGAAWLRANFPEAQRIHLMGDSAGGNLALMLAHLLCDKHLLEQLDPALSELPLPDVASVVSLYGVLDRLSWIEHGFPGAKLMLHCYGGPAAFAAEVAPELQITPLDLNRPAPRPCYLAAGTTDPLFRSSELAYEVLQNGHQQVRFEAYADEGHGFLNFAPTKHEDARERLKGEIGAFLAHAEESPPGP